MTAAVRMRLARELVHEIRSVRAEETATALDRGYGAMALAAVKARPAGPARAVEAAIWARRARERGIDPVTVAIIGRETADELDAAAELLHALDMRGAR